ncbi:MAG: hypothetical protein IJP97_06230 [Synergistaceae bacterium]|nr:hypothetical protein [Synergistaceae bacterium]
MIEDVSLSAYITRAVIVLICMSLCAYFILRYAKKHNIHAKNHTHMVEILSSLRLTGRDIFLVVHCGPDVIAFTLGSHGACLMGRWSYHEWLELEQSQSQMQSQNHS